MEKFVYILVVNFRKIILPIIILAVGTVAVQMVVYGFTLRDNYGYEYYGENYEKYKSTGRFVYDDYSEEEIKNIISLLDDRADGAVYAAITFYGLGGAVCEKNKEDGSFYYRDAKFILGFQSLFQDDKYKSEYTKWFLEKFNFIKEITRGSFINFPLTDLDVYGYEYYGENYEKLKSIKAKYDPYGKFSFEQSI